MAAGTSIVCSDIHGYKGVVRRNEQALLVRPKDIDALAGALSTLLRDPEMRARFGASGRERARQYGWDNITAKVDDSCGICGKTITKGVMIIGKMPIVAAAPSTPPVTKLVTPPSTAAPSPAAVNVPLPAVAARPVQTVTTRPQASSAAVVAASSSSSVPCSCPKIIISDPERSDSDLVFTTKIFDLATTNKLTYIWTIVGGSVVSQEGRSIRVKPGIVGGSVNVIVNGLQPKCDCPNSAQMKF
jgi:hypothetical protein